MVCRAPGTIVQAAKYIKLIVMKLGVSVEQGSEKNPFSLVADLVSLSQVLRDIAFGFRESLPSTIKSSTQQ